MPSNKKNEVLEKARDLKQRATDTLNPERAAGIIIELIVIMVDVAKQLHAEMPEARARLDLKTD